MARTFYENFKYSMASVGLPAPTDLFDTEQKAIATISAITAVVTTYGPDVTIAELVGAGALTDFLIVAGGISASFYAGACVGAFLYASGEWSYDKIAPKLNNVDILIQKVRSKGISVAPREALITHSVASRMYVSG